MHRIRRTGIVVGVVMRIGRAAHAVARLYVNAQSVALFRHDGGGPDFDLALYGLPGLEPQPLVVRVIRAKRQGALAVELAMRCAEPSLRQAGNRLPMLADLAHVLAIEADV